DVVAAGWLQLARVLPGDAGDVHEPLTAVVVVRVEPVRGVYGRGIELCLRWTRVRVSRQDREYGKKHGRQQTSCCAHRWSPLLPRSVDALRSANSTMTCLRSPSSTALRVRIFSARYLGVDLGGAKLRRLRPRRSSEGSPTTPTELHARLVGEPAGGTGR